MLGEPLPPLLFELLLAFLAFRFFFRVFPKLRWPEVPRADDDAATEATGGAIRGCIAVEAVASDEVMITVPRKLVICPPLCFECDALKRCYAGNPSLFKGDHDTVLCLYLMRERLRGDASFWKPYLDIMPWPGGVGDWSDEELSELQDPVLLDEARRRTPSLRCAWRRLLERCGPEHFPEAGVSEANGYTFGLYRWA